MKSPVKSFAAAIAACSFALASGIAAAYPSGTVKIVVPSAPGGVTDPVAGVDIQHVPYKGTGPATTDLIGGQVQMMFGNIPAAAPFVKDGKLRPLGVTGLKRSPAFPDVPTIAESGVQGFNVTSYLILVAAAGTPPDIVRKINAEMNEVWALPAGQKILADLYLDWQKQSPEELTAFLAAESEKWTKLIKEANIKGE